MWWIWRDSVAPDAVLLPTMSEDIRGRWFLSKKCISNKISSTETERSVAVALQKCVMRYVMFVISPRTLHRCVDMEKIHDESFPCKQMQM